MLQLSFPRYPLLAIALAAWGSIASAQAEDAPQPATAAEAAPPPISAKRVVYVPESLKAELREELRQEILEQAKREGWAAPGAVPQWLSRLRIRGDVRARWEAAMFPEGNADELPDFHAINTNRPFDLNGLDLANDRWLNGDEDRQRPRLRARLGLDSELGRGFSAGLRLASGDSSSPVSTNQTLGSSFGRYAFWIDRAAIRWAAKEQGLAVHLGRFENPFFGTELVWDDDLNLDGLAVRAQTKIFGLEPFATAGAFPVFVTALNYPAERSDKFGSLDKWLYGAQLGAAWKPGSRLTVKAGAGFFLFDGVEGKASSPCDTNLKDLTCDTDHSRPVFAQKGNTYMALRTPSARALEAEAAGGGAVPRYQFFGLASEFQELVATASVDARVAPSLRATLTGEWVKNVAFSRRDVEAESVNNWDACDPSNVCERFGGGDQGWLGKLAIGSAVPDRRWSWNVGVGYRYLESDAVVDAFTDSDFGLGGTNLQGFVYGGALSVADGVTTSARWLSADEVAGSPWRVDVLQLDLVARF